MSVASRARAIEEALRKLARDEKETSVLSLEQMKQRNSRFRVIPAYLSKKVRGRKSDKDLDTRQISKESLMSDLSLTSARGGDTNEDHHIEKKMNKVHSGTKKSKVKVHRKNEVKRNNNKTNRRKVTKQEMKLQVDTGDYTAKDNHVHDSPRSINALSFSPLTQSPCSSNSSDVSGMDTEQQLHGRVTGSASQKSRDGNRSRHTCEKKDAVDLRAVGQAMERMKQQRQAQGQAQAQGVGFRQGGKREIVGGRNSTTVGKPRDVQQNADYLTRKNLEVNRNTMRASPKTESSDSLNERMLYSSSRESGDFATGQIRRNSSRLPKAKVLIARRKSITKDGGRLDSDNEDEVADPGITSTPTLPSSDESENSEEMNTAKTRKLVTEYEDPKELLKGRVSLINLMADERGDTTGNTQAEYDAPPASGIEEGELAEITQVDDDSRFLDFSSTFISPYRANMDRQVAPRRKDPKWAKRYDEFLDAEDLNSKMELLMREGEFKKAAGNITKDRPPASKKKRRMFRFRRSQKAKAEEVPVYEQRQVAVRKNDYTSRSLRDRRSSYMSGALERVSMACDPFIDFMAGRESVQVSGAIVVPSPVGWLRRKFSRRTRRHNVPRIMSS